uniref:ADF-H domain-containing protein n=1 Tax=Meloidogyne hapla TaxID=6305 RepID=A0A1I8B4I2_MELHA
MACDNARRQDRVPSQGGFAAGAGRGAEDREQRRHDPALQGQVHEVSVILFAQRRTKAQLIRSFIFQQRAHQDPATCWHPETWKRGDGQAAAPDEGRPARGRPSMLVAALFTSATIKLFSFSDVAVYNHDTEDSNTKARMQWDMVKKEQGIKRLYVRFERE